MLIPDDQYTFSTFAGTAGGPGSRDGAGAAARFHRPRNIAIDAVGNFYVADAINNTVRKITPDAVVTTIAGSPEQRGSDDGVGSAARFRNPSDVAVDGDGNLYVADQDNHTIRKITSQGVVTTLAGRAEDLDGNGHNDGGYEDGVGSDALFNYPAGVAVDSGGNVYVAYTQNHVVRKVTTPSGVTTLDYCLQRACSHPGQSGSDAVHRIGQCRLVRCECLAPRACPPNAVRRIGPDGMVSTVASSTEIFGASNFGLPWGLAVDSAGGIYVAETQVGPSIRKISPEGTVTTLAGPTWNLDTFEPGNVDGQGTAARFGGVLGLVFGHREGVLFAVDTGNHTIRRITAGGFVTTFAGPPGIGRVNGSAGIALDTNGNIFVADNDSSTIRKVAPDGRVSIFAGSAFGWGRVCCCGGFDFSRVCHGPLCAFRFRFSGEVCGSGGYDLGNIYWSWSDGILSWPGDSCANRKSIHETKERE
jgi:hypothetical protein